MLPFVKLIIRFFTIIAFNLCGGIFATGKIWKTFQMHTFTHIRGELSTNTHVKIWVRLNLKNISKFKRNNVEEVHKV